MDSLGDYGSLPPESPILQRRNRACLGKGYQAMSSKALDWILLQNWKHRFVSQYKLHKTRVKLWAGQWAPTTRSASSSPLDLLIKQLALHSYKKKKKLQNWKIVFPPSP